MDAGEGRVGGGIADKPEILELVVRVREDIIVEILMIGADRKGRRALRLAEGQVDRLAGFLAERRSAEFIGVGGEVDAARIKLLHIGRALRPRERQRERIVAADIPDRSEAHTSELQSIMRNSYAVFCLKKKKHLSFN